MAISVIVSLDCGQSHEHVECAVSEEHEGMGYRVVFLLSTSTPTRKELDGSRYQRVSRTYGSGTKNLRIGRCLMLDSNLIDVSKKGPPAFRRRAQSFGAGKKFLLLRGINS